MNQLPHHISRVIRASNLKRLPEEAPNRHSSWLTFFVIITIFVVFILSSQRIQNFVRVR